MRFTPVVSTLGLVAAVVPFLISPANASGAGPSELGAQSTSTRVRLPLCGACPPNPSSSYEYFGKWSIQCTPFGQGELWYYVKSTYTCSSGTYYTCSADFYVGGCMSVPAKTPCPSSDCRPI
jgi:hypothetical protein